MAKDQFDKDTKDLLEAPKKQKKPGRPLKHGFKMSPAQKMSAMREKIRLTIETQNPDFWDERVCCEAMTNIKYEKYRELAWKRYGKINNFK